MKRRDFVRFALTAALTAGNSTLNRNHALAGLRNDDSERLLVSLFREPPSSARPRVFWNWLNGFVSEAQLTMDLEEMYRQGVRGALIFDVSPGTTSSDSFRGPVPASGTPISPVTVPVGAVFMSPEWRKLFQHAIRESARLGLEIGLMLSSGWNCGGSWITPPHASRRLVWSEVQVIGPGPYSGVLPPPVPQVEGRHLQFQPETVEDIAIVAVPENGAAFGRIDDWELKAGYREVEETTPDLLKWVEKKHGQVCIPLASVIDLTSRLDAGAKLTWDVPAGKWIILRLAHALGGRPRQLFSPGGGGLMLDHLSSEAMDIHFRATAEKLIVDAGELAGTTFKFLECDSCDLGTVNWTPDFPAEFKRRRGYDLKLYLPALMGRAVESREITERFLYDFRRTIGDCIADNHYGRFRELCRPHGLRLMSESGGPPPVLIDALQCLGRNDVPMAEFWARDRTMYVRGAASAAHINGRRLVAAEALSTWEQWTQTPRELKSYADRAFCEGVNLCCIHGFSSSPPSAGKPGFVYTAGTHFNPNITWWDHAKAFVDYLARCQYMLQQGLPVVDVCCYYGDQVPNFIPPNRNYWYELCPSLGENYACDFANLETLLTRVEVQDGRIVLPDGMSYRVLVFPESIAEGFRCYSRLIQPELLNKLLHLVNAGATILWSRPSMAPGLRDYPRCDEQVRSLSDKLWGPKEDKTTEEHALGRGKVIWGKSPRQVLFDHGVAPDFEYRPLAPRSRQGLAWTHRRDGDTDIYFVSNRNNMDWIEACCLFRVKGKAPAIWFADTGQTKNLFIYDEAGERTFVPLRLPPAGSVFVVFQSPSEPSRIISVERNGHPIFVPQSGEVQLAALEITSADESSAEAIVSAAGTYRLKNARGNVLSASVPPFAERSVLSGPWLLRFTRGPGAPRELVLDHLISWTEHKDPMIRYFSGTATYESEFSLAGDLWGDNMRIELDLGVVKELAEIILNGKQQGLLWKLPFRTDITKHVRLGKNHLTIQVTNLWPNRLIGDTFLPEEKRFTRTNSAAFTRQSPLLESGLLGPVELCFSRRIIFR